METQTINLRDLPVDLVRRAKACAALHGMTLRDFVMRAIQKATEEDIPAFAGSHLRAAFGQDARSSTSVRPPKERRLKRERTTNDE